MISTLRKLNAEIEIKVLDSFINGFIIDKCNIHNLQTGNWLDRTTCSLIYSFSVFIFCGQIVDNSLEGLLIHSLGHTIKRLWFSSQMFQNVLCQVKEVLREDC